MNPRGRTGLVAVAFSLCVACSPSGDDWPECEPGEGMRIETGLGGETTWPDLNQPSLVQHARSCSVDALRAKENKSGRRALSLDMTCMHPDEGLQTMDLRMSDRETMGDRLDFLVGREDLCFDFQLASLWSENGHDDNVTLREEDGTLLLAATVTNPRAGPDGPWDGVGVGAPLDHLDDPGVWYRPFQSFAIRNGLCPDTDLDHSRGWGDAGWERRLAIEVETEVGTFRAFDRSEHRGIELAEGTYDFIVGDAYFMAETSCADCPSASVSFLVVRTDNEG